MTDGEADPVPVGGLIGSRMSLRRRAKCNMSQYSVSSVDTVADIKVKVCQSMRMINYIIITRQQCI